jgi:hypothetical protein
MVMHALSPICRRLAITTFAEDIVNVIPGTYNVRPSSSSPRRIDAHCYSPKARVSLRPPSAVRLHAWRRSRVKQAAIPLIIAARHTKAQLGGTRRDNWRNGAKAQEFRFRLAIGHC